MEDFGLRTLTVISAVATHRSFRGAANSLEISPSSVSHIVANVEKRLGIRLFHRNTRSVSLTEAGATFLERVRPALIEITDAIEGVHHLRDSPAGLIRLNASTWAADRVLPIILNFMADYPQVSIDLVTEGRLIDIVADGFDAGLRLESVVPQDMVAIALGIDEALIIVASPAYILEHGTPLTPGDLLTHECIRARLPSGVVMRWDMGKRGETLVDVTGRLIVGTTDLALKAAARGMGIAYAEAREASSFLACGELVQLLAEWTPAFPGHALYYPRQRLSSATFRAFVDYFKAQSGKSIEPRGGHPADAP